MRQVALIAAQEKKKEKRRKGFTDTCFYVQSFQSILKCFKLKSIIQICTKMLLKVTNTEFEPASLKLTKWP